MTTITKERLLTIKEWRETYGPGSNVVLPAEEAEELARIALASLEAEPVAWMRDDAGGREYNARNEFSGGGGGVPLYATPPVPVVPEEKPMPNPLSMYAVDAVAAIAEVRGWNACREAMLQSQGEGNPHATPTRLPGGFTIEDAKELHEDLVRSHISQALSGEKMKKKDRDADLRWIHGVIVQAAWFVKASLDALPEPLREKKGGSANCAISHGKIDNALVSGNQVNELTMLVKQLVRKLKKADPGCELPDKATGYLELHGLISVEDILR
ncbi:hypothetical protein [Escherichia coli]|uniref:hypothetical protein n=1 Tax=Escherichia coli TaxID=562 RepID=UPI001E2CF48A|nr:hypothetical protein [Escherichia coli]HAV8727206.1 hypothetical protein [Escherichia coli]HAV8764284.1 hypothetical protein [Escherichia coli]HAV8993246.1 hypothetical protein [Escherichia coli]HAV9027462.1 hypothetical protein [Escherichia coli]HAW1184693.1 hypothetical protein [Escherichia coli]